MNFTESQIERYSRQIMTIIPSQSACYRCLYQEPPPPGLIPSCQEAGVLGTIPGIIGLMQATETVKWILGKGRLLTNRMIILSGLDMEFNELAISRSTACPVCGDLPSIRELREENYKTNHVCETECR